jgi:hypothetical protein
VNAEGWYVDPFGIHEPRWFSDGTPTELVRDGGVESHDPPSSTSYTRALEPVVEAGSPGPDDLRRADDGEAEQGAHDESTWEVFDESAATD